MKLIMTTTIIAGCALTHTSKYQRIIPISAIQRALAHAYAASGRRTGG
jgi:hypothetical protein